ncbi:MAG TPA: EfeM/EfeO family lipoprotein, partial [Microthrixaceae bacterium]|nr:EfeM/EfeO family lipoprotein [Microthrixaceae bacterium]
AESFGDLDPRLDLREADLEAGQEWTGWHQIEKQLWPPADFTEIDTPEERAKMADQLVADTQDLATRVESVTFKADQLGNGAKELLDEVATGKVTGEEEFWSHTDLWDFQANVDGARLAYQALRPIVLIKDKDLAATLDEEFASLQTELDKYKTADGFQYYTQLTPEQVKELSDSVNALGEPLSQLTAVVVL